MNQELKTCWEIVGCGREHGGTRVDDLGECIASVEGLGHNCWIIAGTYCAGEVQGSRAQKLETCKDCEIYGLYNTETGSERYRAHLVQTAELRSYNNALVSRRVRSQR